MDTPNKQRIVTIVLAIAEKQLQILLGNYPIIPHLTNHVYHHYKNASSSVLFSSVSIQLQRVADCTRPFKLIKKEMNIHGLTLFE